MALRTPDPLSAPLPAPGTAYFRSYLGRHVQSWTIHSAVVERAQMRRWAGFSSSIFVLIKSDNFKFFSFSDPTFSSPFSLNRVSMNMGHMGKMEK